jgi:hypothetical protein
MLSTGKGKHPSLSGNSFAIAQHRLIRSDVISQTGDKTLRLTNSFGHSAGVFQL